jgi:hypothetical protein
MLSLTGFHFNACNTAPEDGRAPAGWKSAKAFSKIGINLFHGGLRATA